MATSTLQILPSADELAQLDPAALASIPAGVSYDLKRLKVYSSCLRCRAKKVKCDRKEPCSRCEKHSVECSYRELANVQLDIRQFQRHLNNPKIRKDGAGIITSTATPVITLGTAPSTSTPLPAPQNMSASPTSHHHSFNTLNVKTPPKFASSSPTMGSFSSQTSPVPHSAGSTDTESDTPIQVVSAKVAAKERAKVHKVHRRKPSSKASKNISQEPAVYGMEQAPIRMDLRELATRAEELEAFADMSVSSETEDENANVPIWQAQAVGKHKQTEHEQDMAEAFGLAAYLKAKETEMKEDPARAGQTIDYEMELERALAQRMPSSFSRADRSCSRARKHGQSGYNPSMPYARPSYCQLSSPRDNHSHSSSARTSPKATVASPPTAAQCCCQIAAQQGQALGSCPFSNVSHSGYDKSALTTPPPQQVTLDSRDSMAQRISYSPSAAPSTCSPSLAAGSISPAKIGSSMDDFWSSNTTRSYSSMLPPPVAISTSSSSTLPSIMRMDICSPNIELAPIRMPEIHMPAPSSLPTIHLPPSSDLSAFEVGRDGDEPIQIECKYNEPNVDAWDMIEKPLSRTIPLTTKRGRSIKMEMGWILS